MSEHEQNYRRKAEQARKTALATQMDYDREFWLYLAEQWDLLAKEAAKQAKFELREDAGE